jgi:outer membrane cobalamin receptor
MPGVFLRDYGGLGGLKTISLRGLGATQTLVVWEGVPLNTALHGLFDLSMVPASFLEELSLTAGGNSAVAGAYAGVGIVQLRTLPAVPKPLLRTIVGMGSFGEGRLAVQGTAVGSNAVVKLGMEYVGARGDYPFPTEQFGQLRMERRSNGDYRSMALMAAAGYAISGLRAEVQALEFQSWRGVPGAVVQGRVEFAQARLEEAHSLALARFWVLPLRLEGRAAVRRTWLHYRDPEARVWGPNGADEEATTWEAGAKLLWSGDIARLGSELWAEGRWESAVGTLLRPSGQEVAQRRSAALGISLARAYGGLQLRSALRWEAHRQYAPAFSPMLGVQYDRGRVRVQLQWSANFRPPTFAELYYFNFGDPRLRPERTNSWNLGVQWLPWEGVRLRGDVFSVWVRDQILAVPRSPVFWSARNIGRVWSRGVELSGEVQLGAHWHCWGSLTWQRVTDQTENPYTRGRQLPYTPLLMAAGRVEASFGAVRASVTLTVLGQRWSQPDNAPESRMPPAVLADVGAGYGRMLTQHLQAELRLAVRNVLDTHYAVIRNYPLPGRSLRLEAELSWAPHGERVSSHARH